MNEINEITNQLHEAEPLLENYVGSATQEIRRFYGN
jgi:hypothetical protein